MNEYEKKQESRRLRFKALSEKASKTGEAYSTRAHNMASIIPFGQPILVGHHSERADRRYRERIHNIHDKAFSEHKKAEYYNRKAASVGTGGISSDDPEAVQKLKSQLDTLVALQEKMKQGNKVIKKHKNDNDKIAALVDLGFNESQAIKILTPDFCGRVGFPDYELKNNNANIRRIKKRIESLEKWQSVETIEKQGAGYIYREDTEENRVMLIFDGKPSSEIRTVLKRNAFKWSPSRGAWVRHLNNAGIYAAQQVIKFIES